MPSPGGTTWSPQAVKNVVTHPLYRGEYRHGEMRTVARGGTLVCVRAPEAEVLRIAHPELRVWPDALLARLDALLARPRRKAWGAATPKHLASSFLRCGVCGSSLVVSGTKKRNNLSYVCDRHRMHGRSACRGIGYRAEHAVDSALLRALAPFIDGEVAERALGLLKDQLEAQATGSGRESARARVQRDLDAAERRAKNLADAIARGGEMDALLAALRQETSRIEGLKSDLGRLDHTAPVAVDASAILATARKRLAALSKLLRKGGVEARPVVAAVLGSDRLVVTPIEVKGSRRWQLAGQISAGYLVSHVVKEASAPLPSCAAPRELPCALRPPLPLLDRQRRTRLFGLRPKSARTSDVLPMGWARPEAGRPRATHGEHGALMGHGRVLLAQGCAPYVGSTLATVGWARAWRRRPGRYPWEGARYPREGRSLPMGGPPAPDGMNARYPMGARAPCGHGGWEWRGLDARIPLEELGLPVGWAHGYRGRDARLASGWMGACAWRSSGMAGGFSVGLSLEGWSPDA